MLILNYCSTTIRSDILIMALITCSTITTVMPLSLIFLINSKAYVISVGVKPVITSSSNINAGSVARTLAISSLFSSIKVRSLARESVFHLDPQTLRALAYMNAPYLILCVRQKPLQPLYF